MKFEMHAKTDVCLVRRRLSALLYWPRRALIICKLSSVILVILIISSVLKRGQLLQEFPSHRYMCGELIALLALKLDTHTLVLVATKSFDHLMYGLSCLAEYSTPAKRSATLKYDPVTSATPNLSLPSQYCFDYPAFLAHRRYRFPHLLDHYQEC
jgi:hypothetical protein